MAINYGIEILVDTSVSDDEKATLTRRILQVLESLTLSIEYNKTYAAGDTSSNFITLCIGGYNTDFGIRVLFDTAVIGTRHGSIIRRIIQVVEGSTSAINHAGSYIEGNRTYNLVISLL